MTIAVHNFFYCNIQIVCILTANKSKMLATKFNSLKSYFIEFIMIFLAISLGFIAENIRERNMIDRTMKENYESLIYDLRQDSINLFINRTKIDPIQGLVDLNQLLYDYHKEDLSWENLKVALIKLEQLPGYGTLFINNSTFKNIQSSGHLSAIKNLKLKSELSYYYEVLFKRLNDNNRNFDKIGIDFFNQKFPLLSYNFYNTYIDKTALKKPEDYKEYLLNFDSAKTIFTSEKLVYDLDAYTGQLIYYATVKDEVYQLNQKILKELYTIHNKNF